VPVTEVEIVNVSGDALSWLKTLMVVQMALGLVLIVCLVAITVVVLWRGA
jgi:hypothetical protein